MIFILHRVHNRQFLSIYTIYTILYYNTMLSMNDAQFLALYYTNDSSETPITKVINACPTHTLIDCRFPCQSNINHLLEN